MLSGPCWNKCKHIPAEPEECLALGCNLILLLSVFFRPMDLTSIKRRLSKGHIKSVIQFQRDLMLMFQNAMMYNSFNHHVHHMAMEMQQEVLEQLQMLCEALLCSRGRLGLGRR